MKFPRSSRTGIEVVIPAGAGMDEEAARGPMVESWSWLDVMASMWLVDLSYAGRTSRNDWIAASAT
jgi:hypothetical protein